MNLSVSPSSILKTNFILQLPKSFQAKNVYASDIDLMSVLIARVNFAVKFNVQDRDLVYLNIKVSDYLANFSDKKFDYIIGNPPWGFEFSEDKKFHPRPPLSPPSSPQKASPRGFSPPSCLRAFFRSIAPA